ncbi:MAG: conjugal transfer protein TraG N-terminal domain-containing protein [Rickettsiaceae bacterium]|nr:conjugal transfer protein TraG N-terminal domain-containing protein [Rickettsiaceae bacterium]MCP5378278.1 conjugal transfer protein TraG N-terminal domain-containing protein [Rickettsiaceae bacterium]
MDLTIHAYGYSELLFHTLQGLAMFRESNFYPTVINTMVLLVGTYLAMQMAASKAEGQWRQYLLKCLGMIVFVNSLLLPKASMFIRDHVEKSYWKVDNIPLAFALPIGAIESFGHIITMGFEQTFSLVGSRSSLLYYHYGTVFGARLAKEVLEAKIRDPEVVGNMRNFIGRCVILPAMIGHKFTKEELVATNDIWGLVSKNAGTLTRVDMTAHGVRVHPSPTCKEAVGYFETKFSSLEGGIITTLSQKFRGAGKGVEYNSGLRQLNKNISTAIAALYDGGHKVDAILKNNMMINAINSYRSGKYATARAQMHQEAGGLLSGDLAEKTLTGSLAVMKVIVYGSFIFLLPMLILTGGFTRYKSWITMAFSLSLWPPLYSILNMVIDFAYEPAKVVSYSSWSTEVKKFDSIAGLAAGLSISIPFLAYYMTRLGEGGLTQLAGTIMASSNAAVSAIAGERSSGMRNWDNDNIDNVSRHNSNGFKTNHNLEYVSGENGWNLADGSHFKLTAGGKQIITGGHGLTSSGGDVSMRSEESNHVMLNEGVNKQKSLASSEQVMFTESQAKTISHQASMLESIAEHTRSGSGYNIDTSTEEGKTVDKVLHEIDSLNKSNNYGWRQNAEAVLEAHSGFDLPFGLGGVTAKGSVSAGNFSDQQNSGSLTINKEDNSKETYNNITRALNNDSWTKEHGVSQDQSKGLHESYEETQRAEKQLADRYDKIDTYQRAIELNRSRGGVINKELYQDVTEAHAKRSGKSVMDARKDVENMTPEVRKIFRELSEPGVNQLLAEVEAGKRALSSNNVHQKLDDKHKQYKSNVDSNVGDEVEKEAAAKGFNVDYIRKDVEATGEINKNRFNHLNNKVNDKYDSTRDATQLHYDQMQKVIEQNEKNRLGQGGMLGNWAGRPREEMLSLANSAQNESTISNDLDDILPRYKQYTGEVPALHDIDQGNSRVQGFDPRLKITRLKPGESHKYQKLVKMEEERKLKRNEGQKVD